MKRFLFLALAACSQSPMMMNNPMPDAGTPDVSNTKDIVQKVSIGPFAINPGDEQTLCVVVPFGNMDDLVIRSFEVSLAPGSHHLILYQTTAAAQPTPYPCSPFTGIASGTDVPIVFAGKQQATFTFPMGIAQEIPAGTMVKVEAHYINTTMQTLMGQGTVTFHGEPKATAAPFQPANFIFWGTGQINVPPNASASTGPLFQAGIAGTHLILVTTHEHRLGTDARVWESPAAGQMGTMIADDKDWSNPSWKLLSPQFDFDGTSGLTFQCDWTNTTAQAVTFGESALNEMCFIGGYYYPSKGLDLCIDHYCRNRK